MTKLPWQKWFHADWLSDSSVGKCSLAARGLWVELLNVMMSDGVSSVTGTPDQLARNARCTVAELLPAIEELKNTNCATVTHSNNFVTLTCRRLEREEKARKNTAERVKRYRTKKDCNADGNGIEVRRQKSEVRKEKDFVSDDDWILPDGWECPEVREALAGFEAMRRRIRKPISSRASTSKIFKKFESVTHLIEVLELCEANGWQGLNPEYAQPKRNNSALTTAQKREANMAVVREKIAARSADRPDKLRLAND